MRAVTVNKELKEAVKLMGTAVFAVWIHHHKQTLSHYKQSFDQLQHKILIIATIIKTNLIMYSNIAVY